MADGWLSTSRTPWFRPAMALRPEYLMETKPTNHWIINSNKLHQTPGAWRQHTLKHHQQRRVVSERYQFQKNLVQYQWSDCTASPFLAASTTAVQPLRPYTPKFLLGERPWLFMTATKSSYPGNHRPRRVLLASAAQSSWHSMEYADYLSWPRQVSGGWHKALLRLGSGTPSLADAVPTQTR